MKPAYFIMHQMREKLGREKADDTYQMLDWGSHNAVVKFFCHEGTSYTL